MTIRVNISLRLSVQLLVRLVVLTYRHSTMRLSGPEMKYIMRLAAIGSAYRFDNLLQHRRGEIVFKA